MGGIPKLNLKTVIEHKHQVLTGRLAGRPLCDRLRQVVTVPRERQAENIAFANEMWLHAMVNAPALADRAAAFELGHDFAAEVSKVEEVTNYRPGEYLLNPLAIKPVPHTPVVRRVQYYDALWFGRLFPEAEIDWAYTYEYLAEEKLLEDAVDCFVRGGLLAADPRLCIEKTRFIDEMGAAVGEARRRAGGSALSAAYNLGIAVDQMKPLVLTGYDVTPAYDQMCLNDEMRSDPQRALHVFRLAMVMRGRGIDYKGQNVLSYPHDPEFRTIASDGAEEIFTFYIEETRDFLCMFVKNNWPVGYAFAFPVVAEGNEKASSDYVAVNLHVFTEFRAEKPDGVDGTTALEISSASRLFRMFLHAAREQFSPANFLIFRNPMTELTDARGELADVRRTLAGFDRFLGKEGFADLGPNPFYEDRTMFMPAILI